MSRYKKVTRWTIDKGLRLPKPTITHRNGGFEQGILEAVNQDGLLNDADKKRLEHLRGLPPDRVETRGQHIRQKIKTTTMKGKYEQVSEHLEWWTERNKMFFSFDEADLFREAAALLRQKGQEVPTPQLIEVLEVLCSMWDQYCDGPTGHMFMSAGEECQEVLSKYGLLKNETPAGGEIDYDKLEQYKNLSSKGQ